VRERVVEASHRVAVGVLHLLEILDEDELGEVEIDRGAREVRPRGAGMARRQGLTAQGLVLRSAARPRRAPLPPTFETGGYAFEVRRAYPVGGEPRLPMRDRACDELVDDALLSSDRYRCEWCKRLRGR
jgi:hypothetical protein